MNFSLIVIGRLNSLIATITIYNQGGRVTELVVVSYIVTVGGFHLSNLKITVNYKPFVFYLEGTTCWSVCVKWVAV